jgi:hypothetical protein
MGSRIVFVTEVDAAAPLEDRELAGRILRRIEDNSN